MNPRVLKQWILAFLLLFASVAMGKEEEVCRINENGEKTCKAMPQGATQDDACKDDHGTCEEWASSGECGSNPGYMKQHCRKACRECFPVGHPASSKEGLATGSDMGTPQTVLASNLKVERHAVEAHILESRKYMRSKVIDEMGTSVLDKCQNSHEMCSIWAILGECDNNASYMKKSCAPACKSCEYLTVEGRCPLDPNAPNAWKPGDLDAMFRRLSSEPFLSQYDVKVLSSPDTTKGPWVLTMENVVTREEAERLIELGTIEGYKRSTDVGKKKPDGTFEEKVSTGRTSTNAWCQHECYEDAAAQQVIHRISNFTGINETNSEYLQLLRYETDQKYSRHHDYIPHELKRQQGVRILTVYLYLNDVEAGGGTNFPILDVTVMPKRGRVLLWPSVLDDAPEKKDSRTDHQALPVEAGVKFGANAWFHIRDFKTANRNHCQ